MTTMADFIGSHPLLILSHRGTDAGCWETGKDAHVIRTCGHGFLAYGTSPGRSTAHQ
jgi:hypothetical protein